MRLQDLAHTCSLSMFGLVAPVLPLSPQQATVRGSFIATRGPDTTSIERFTRVGDRLDGELVSRRLPWS